MSPTTRTVRITDPGAPSLRIALEVPEDWAAPDLPDTLPAEVLCVLSDGGALTAGFSTNVVVLAQELPEGLALDDWQRQALAQQLSTLPDVQVFDDRVTEAPTPTWYRARVATGEGPATLLVREWSRIVGGRGLTLTLTTVPPVDAAHGDLLDAIAGSWTTQLDEDAPATGEEDA